MELKHLQSFVVIAEEGHVTRAAKRLNIVQPALSQQIRSLEEELGVKLLRRVGRGIELTSAGRLLQAEGQNILAHVHSVSKRTRELNGASRRTITIAATPVGAFAKCVTASLQRFRQIKPDVLIREVLMEPSDIAPALRDLQIDAAFACATVADRHDVKQYKLAAEQSRVAIPSSHPLAKRTSIPLALLAQEPFILPTHGEVPGSFESKLRKSFADLGLSPILLEPSPNALLALSKVASATGIALVPECLTGFRSDVITYRPLSGCSDLTVEYALYLRRQEKASDVLALMSLSVEQ